MLMIKLTRKGKKKQPTYRLIVVEKHKDPWGDFVEIVGHYNPRSKECELKADRITHWMSVGAQPTDTVNNLLISQGVIEAKKKKVSSLGKKYKAKVKAEADEKKAKELEAKEAAAAEKEAKKAEAEAKKAEAEKPAEEKVEEAPKEEKKEEAPAAEEKKEESASAEATADTEKK